MPKRNSQDKNNNNNNNNEPESKYPEHCRVFLISDVHTDEEPNWVSVLEKMDTKLYDPETDYLILAGDISKYDDVIEKTFEIIRPNFKQVFFVPGNNELRLRKKDSFSDSIQKFDHVLELCKTHDVCTDPMQISDKVTVVPLFGWYQPDFNPKWKLGDSHYQRRWLDFYTVKWPQELQNDRFDGAAKYFLDLNEKSGRVKQYDTPLVISFSHFMPSYELAPPSLFTKKDFANVIGCQGLDVQLRQIGAKIHCFGHTHISLDKVVNGIRYVQHATGHPSEQSAFWYSGGVAPKLIYDSTEKKSDCLIQ